MIKKILITAGRTFSGLDLARSFHKLGHEVYTTDPHYFQLCRFSNSVKKSFVTVSPRANPKKYIQQTVDIVKKYDIDLVVPVLEETIYLAKERDQFPEKTKIFCDPYKTLISLHNKWYFSQLLDELKISGPKSSLITNREELDNLSLTYPYFLKASYSRASQGAWKIDSKEDLSKFTFSKDNPLIAQQLIQGRKYCSYSVCHNGKISAHTTYPVNLAISGSSCISFEAIEHQKILDWTANLVSKMNFTGQIAFDFIEEEDGSLFAIECNPRATSGIHLFSDKEDFISSFLMPLDDPIFPSTGTLRKLGAGMLLYGWREQPFKHFFKNLLLAKDVIFSKKDLMPFFCQPLLFLSTIYYSLKYHQNLCSIFTYDFDFNSHNEKNRYS